MNLASKSRDLASAASSRQHFRLISENRGNPGDWKKILLKEREWDGRIESGERFDCDFAVQLDAACMSLN